MKQKSMLIVFILVVGLNVFAQFPEELTKLSKEDMKIIFKDASPVTLERLAEDQDYRKARIKEIKEFLAIAKEARTIGLANKEDVKAGLEEIRMTITAINYDKEKNKDKANLPPLASITKEEVDAFFQKGDNRAKFDKKLSEQIERAKKEGRIAANYQLQPKQFEEAKEIYAKVRILAEEAKANWSSLSPEFKYETGLQIKLQQAQYLERIYSSKMIDEKIAANQPEIDRYLAEHPEEVKILNEKKAKAEEILKRAKAGEDFVKLAQEFTEEPGSKKDGGLYKKVTKSGMSDKEVFKSGIVPEFEQAVLGLQPGQVADKIVESKSGYHIIKLEKKRMTKDAEGKETETYNVRHILISMMSPGNSRGLPLKDKIKEKIEKEKRQKIVDVFVVRHQIEVAEDFKIEVPEPSESPKLSQKQKEQLEKESQEAK